MEVGSANNYSLGSADRASLNSERLGMRKSEGLGIQPAIPGISPREIAGEAPDC